MVDFSLHGVHRVRKGKITGMDLVWDAGVLIGEPKYQRHDQTAAHDAFLVQVGAYVMFFLGRNLVQFIMCNEPGHQ